jgi:peptidyl-prolyl cis-trans isomerase B (cyclophilin B)
MRLRNVSFVGLCAIVGCGKPTPVAETTPTPNVVPTVVATETPTKPAEQPTTPPLVPFEVATTSVLPPGTEVPPDQTLAGKPAAKLASDVRKLWPTINLASDPVPPRATIETELGTIEITFNAQAAPNHVRNFLALAKTGYFDGLVFERTITQVVVTADGLNMPFELITAGCPAGEGSPGRGHLGYFVKPEETTTKHDTGTVGFWHDDDSLAGTRFYITLDPAPEMDGEYTVIGNVSLGMDVVRKIMNAPTKDGGSELPVKPVVIKKATVNR